MKTRLAIALAAIVLVGCETTGDPRQGGFFGWSQAKASAREAGQVQTLTQAERRLADESGRTRGIRARESAVSSDLAHADAQQRLRQDRLKRQYVATLQRAAALEDDAFTSATASRARRLRAEVEAAYGDVKRTPEERTARLHSLERELKTEKIQPAR